MTKDDIIKIIDGIPYYRYEYADFLYEKLQQKDEDIKDLEQKIQDNIRFDENRFKELFEVKKENQLLHSIIKEVREYIDRRDIEWGSEEHNQVLEILDKENSNG